MIDEKEIDNLINSLKHDALCGNVKAARALEKWLRFKNDVRQYDIQTLEDKPKPADQFCDEHKKLLAEREEWEAKRKETQKSLDSLLIYLDEKEQSFISNDLPIIKMMIFLKVSLRKTRDWLTDKDEAQNES